MLVLLESAFVVALVFAGFAFQVDRTVLNAKFVAQELEQTDAINLALNAWLDHLPADVAPYQPALAMTATDLQGWLRTNTREVVRVGAAYLRGETAGLRAEIDLQPLHQSLEKNLQAQLLKNPPPEIAALPPAEQPRARADLEKAVMAQLALPATYRVELSKLAPEQQADLQDLRELIGSFFVAYYGVLGVAVLVGVLLVWLGSVAWLGSGLVLYGFVGVAIATFSREPVLAAIQALLPEVPPSVVAALPQLYAALAQPLLSGGLGSIVVGCGLCVVEWMRRRRGATESSALNAR